MIVATVNAGHVQKLVLPMRARVQAFLAACGADTTLPQVIITDTARSPVTQAQKFAQGRTIPMLRTALASRIMSREAATELQRIIASGTVPPGGVITWTLDSAHLAVPPCALDGAFIVGGHVVWPDPNDSDPGKAAYARRVWESYASHGEAAGLESGGRWSAPDWPHLQMPQWKAVAKSATS